VSLTPIVIAFVIVALVFIAAGAASLRWAGGGWGVGVGVSSPPPRPTWGDAVRAVRLPAAAEALVVTLFAALWFGSLGSGGWVVLFLLVGALAGGADRWVRRRLAAAVPPAPAADDLKLLALTLARYLAAGGLCAWCLT